MATLTTPVSIVTTSTVLSTRQWPQRNPDKFPNASALVVVAPQPPKFYWS